MASYPTKEQLNIIRHWSPLSPLTLIEYIKPLWEEYGTIRLTGKKIKKLYMATGGWSGNEDIIRAMENGDNLFFSLWWQKSERGGAYWFRITPIK